MVKGGKQPGAGRPKVPEEKKPKMLLLNFTTGKKKRSKIL